MPPASAPHPDRPCVFDAIIAGEQPGHLVLDEPELVGFLDVRPVFSGHTLIVPRAHVATLAELPEDLLGPLFEAGRRVAAAQRAALGADGALVLLNDEVSQSVAHVHLHVVPRRFKDGLRGFLWPRITYPDEATAAAVAARLATALPRPGAAR